MPLDIPVTHPDAYDPQKHFVEGVNTSISELSVDISDVDLLKVTDEYISLSKNSSLELSNLYDKNKKYYRGIQLGKDRQVVDNRIFMSIETIVPIATSTEPVPNVLPYQNTKESIELAKSWEKILLDIYRKQKLQKKTEKMVRHLCLAKYAVLKYYYDPDKEEIQTKVIHPKRCLFNNYREIDDGMDWFGEKVTVSAQELIDLFPKKEEEIRLMVKGKLGSQVTYTEFWTDELYIARINEIILSKKKNPNFNYDKKTGNFFQSPKIPYIFVNLFDLGEEMAGDTSLVEQAAPLQDGVNKRKTQIDKNAQIMNGKVVGTGENGMKQQEFANIDWSDSGKGIWMEKGDISDIQRISGVPLPQFVENDMLHSQGEIDNIMGTHSTTRGERTGRETATGRQILRESDRGRIDVIGRRIEEAIIELFQGWTQLVKVFYVKKHYVTILNKDNTREFLEFDRNSIEHGTEISVIKGSLIPEDKASRQQRALTLANAQMISPIDLYREFGIRNPEEVAKRLFLWQNDPMKLFADLEAEAKAGEEGAAEHSVMKANDENQRMAQGEAQPPYQDADANHIAAHEQFIQQPEFANLSADVKQLFVDHIRAEMEQVEAVSKEQL